MGAAQHRGLTSRQATPLSNRHAANDDPRSPLCFCRQASTILRGSRLDGDEVCDGRRALHLKPLTASCSTRSALVTRSCWRRCSIQDSTRNVSTKRAGSAASSNTPQSKAPSRRRSWPRRSSAREESIALRRIDAVLDRDQHRPAVRVDIVALTTAPASASTARDRRRRRSAAASARGAAMRERARGGDEMRERKADQRRDLAPQRAAGRQSRRTGRCRRCESPRPRTHVGSATWAETLSVASIAIQEMPAMTLAASAAAGCRASPNRTSAIAVPTVPPAATLSAPSDASAPEAQRRPRQRRRRLRRGECRRAPARPRPDRAPRAAAAPNRRSRR